MEKFSDRLKEAMKKRDKKQVDLVNATKIGKATICQYLKGCYEPKPTNINKLAKALNVSEAWLMGYDVSMERKEISYHISENEKQLVDFYNLLNDEGKEEAIKRVEELTLLEKYAEEKKYRIKLPARGSAEKEIIVTETEIKRMIEKSEDW